MMSKEDMRKEGIPSPDIFDAFAFAWIEDANDYMVSDTSDYFAVSDSEVLIGAVDDMFAGLELLENAA